MAIDRVKGRVLDADLDRQGRDLYFTTDGSPLLYLDFTNFKVGINTSTLLTAETFTVFGNVKLSGVKIDGATVSTPSDMILSPAGNLYLGDVGKIKIDGGSPTQILTTDGNGNLAWENTSQITANISLGNFTFTGDTITSTGNVVLLPSTGNVINMSGSTITNVGSPVLPTDAATVGYVTNAISTFQTDTIWQGDSNVSVNDAGVGSVVTTVDGTVVQTATVSGVTISNLSVTGSISSPGTLTLSSLANDRIEFQSTSAVTLPSGNDLERPQTPAPGDIRYNSLSAQVEWFNGTIWVSALTAMDVQVLAGDGVNDTFTLSQATNASSIFVMINGVVQSPDIAYTVTGSTIAFIEPPKVGDSIEIRFISLAAPNTKEQSPVVIYNPPAVTVDTLPVTIDSFTPSLYRSAKYTVSIVSPTNESYSADIMLTHNGVTSTITVYGASASGVTDTYNFATRIESGLCLLTVSSFTVGHSCKLQKHYFTA